SPSFPFYGYVAHRVLHSFPTRRSSDLIVALAAFNDEVDGHTGVDLDGVVAVAGADGDLLPPRQLDFVVLAVDVEAEAAVRILGEDRKSTRLNSSHVKISYAVFCLKKKT